MKDGSCPILQGIGIDRLAQRGVARARRLLAGADAEKRPDPDRRRESRAMACWPATTPGNISPMHVMLGRAAIAAIQSTNPIFVTPAEMRAWLEFDEITAFTDAGDWPHRTRPTCGRALGRKHSA